MATTIIMNLKSGPVKIELRPDLAPNHVARITELTKDGFYDGIVFHRVIPGFMAQTGDPNTLDEDRSQWGRGGPGYRFADECKGNPLKHERNVISMANAGPNTNGSQFFITHVPTPHLNGKHTVFGKVTKGLDIVDAIEQGDVMVSVKVAD